MRLNISKVIKLLTYVSFHSTRTHIHLCGWLSNHCHVCLVLSHRSTKKYFPFLMIYGQPLYGAPDMMHAIYFFFYSFWLAYLPPGVYCMAVSMMMGFIRGTWPIYFNSYAQVSNLKSTKCLVDIPKKARCLIFHLFCVFNLCCIFVCDPW